MSDADAPPTKKPSVFEQKLWTTCEVLIGQKAGEDENSWFVNFIKANLRLESAREERPARASFLLNVLPEMTNSMNNLHGGCSATLVDILTSCVLVTVGKPGVFSYGGVTRGLRLTYLSPIPVGTEMRLICEVVQMGRRMSLIKAEIFRVIDGVLCVVAEHEKANTDPDIKKI